MRLSVIGLVGLIHVIILCRVKYLLLSHPTPQACFPPNSCVQFFPLDNPVLMIVSQVLVESVRRSLYFILPSSLVSILNLWALCSYTGLDTHSRSYEVVVCHCPRHHLFRRRRYRRPATPAPRVFCHFQFRRSA